MKLQRARIQNFRSIKDSGWFDIDDVKTILVGPNEGGKTAVLRGLEQLSPGQLVRPLDALRDYPRSDYHLIQTGAVRAEDVLVVEGQYVLDESERHVLAEISPLFAECRFQRAVYLDNSITDTVLHAPAPPTVGALKDHLRQIALHVDVRAPSSSIGDAEGDLEQFTPSQQLERVLATLPDPHPFSVSDATRLTNWLDTLVTPYVDHANEEEMSRLAALREALGAVEAHQRVLEEFRRRLPTMVYVSTYPSVTPMLHLGHLADAIDAGEIDATDDYNFGNHCLLHLLRFSARELSDLGKAVEPPAGDVEAFERYRSQLDERDAALNSASLRLTNHIRSVWSDVADEPSDSASEDVVIRIAADQQYLKVVVEDSLGVQIELDQRSHGFRWLVSFFVVFFAQAADRNQDVVLLLDEPGLSLHPLKQRRFRHTLSRLGEARQLVFATHSPFLIGADELSIVRLVELVDRGAGTKVHGDLAAEDPASLLPLRESIAYGLTSSLFSAPRTLLVEDLSDYWYLQATTTMLRDAGIAAFDGDIEILPVGGLARLAYFSSIAGAGGRTVAALLDTDSAGQHASLQQRLADDLGERRVLRTKDSYEGHVPSPRIEELLRETLVSVARSLGWDVADDAATDWGAQPITEIVAKAAGPEFTPYRLAQEYVRWTRDHRAADLTAAERIGWMGFIDRINQAFTGA